MGLATGAAEIFAFLFAKEGRGRVESVGGREDVHEVMAVEGGGEEWGEGDGVGVEEGHGY